MRSILVHIPERVHRLEVILQLVLLIVFSSSVQCPVWKTYWKWIVNTNVTVGSRYWDSAVTVGSRTFNGSMTHAVAIPRVKDQVNECELIYPLDKLPASVSIDIYNTAEESNCVDEKLSNQIDRVFWLDPRNWDAIAVGSLDKRSKAVPHTERVPCDYDLISIPNTTSTFIVLPPDSVKLYRLQFGNDILHRRMWEHYSKDEYFMQHFLTKSSTNLSDMFVFSSCNDETGCECRKDRMYYDEICAFVSDECPSIEDTPCEKPLLLFGYCCKICGAAVMVEFDKRMFSYNKLESLVENFYEIHNDKTEFEVDMYMSKVNDAQIQIVFWPKIKYSKDLLDLAEELKLLLDKKSNLGINTCWMKGAGEAEGDHGGRSMMANISIGLGIALISGIALIFANKFEWFKRATTQTIFKGLKSTPQGEDKNLQDESIVSQEEEEEEEEVHTTQHEEVADSASEQQHEQANLIDRSD